VVKKDDVSVTFAPTCTGNTYDDAGVLCGAAVSTCQPLGQGIIRYWRWVVTTHPDGSQEVVQTPGTFCLPPGAVGLPPVAVVAGLVERDFQSLVIAKGTTEVRPRGTTLVNYPTEFFTAAKAYTLAPVAILGHRVVITATPERFDWVFGDGEQAPDAGPGQATDSDVTHVYAKTGTVSAHVVITWTGTFTVDGGPERAVIGTAETTGPGTAVVVKQARAELVGG
jgi:hypothetical protein